MKIPVIMLKWINTRKLLKEGAVTKIQESAENYLEAILMLQKRNGSVRSIDVAGELEFSKPSVSVAMKNLRENGFIDVEENGHIILLDKGKEIAERMYERHTFLSDWLIQLGVDKKIALDDACRMEHVLSAESFAAMKAYVNGSNKN